MRSVPIIPDRARLRSVGAPVGVDREAGVLRGYVVAQKGPFKSGRGEFDDRALAQIVEQINAAPTGLKSRFGHPTESNDGLGKYLGRARNARLDGPAVRADLHLDPTAFGTPDGNLGKYVLDLAESDPAAFSSSLVLRVKQEYRLEPDGKPKKDDKGKPLPPLWYPEKLHASDIVDTGDAVDGLLSAGVDPDGLPQGVLWQATEMLDGFLADQSREVVEARLMAWLSRYLDYRYGEQQRKVPTALQLRVRLLELASK